MENIKTYTLENENLKVDISPELGCKIASIYHKQKEFEFIFQPSDGKYIKPEYAGDFSKYDTSGIDDCIPTIDECLYPGTDIKLPDHGDTWSLAYEVLNSSPNNLEACVKLLSIPLSLKKNIRLEGNKILIDFTLTNLSGKDLYYLWAFHGLNNYNETTRLEFPEEYKNYINVQNDEIWDFDIRQIKNFEENSTFKYYFTDKLENGSVSLIHEDPGLKYTIKFDVNDNPYLGVWLTTGGFKNEKNIAIEPCNGFYDSLEKAVENNKAKEIKANSTDEWSIELNIKEL